jgi:hypothetical protein
VADSTGPRGLVTDFLAAHAEHKRRHEAYILALAQHGDLRVMAHPHPRVTEAWELWSLAGDRLTDLTLAVVVTMRAAGVRILGVDARCFLLDVSDDLLAAEDHDRRRGTSPRLSVVPFMSLGSLASIEYALTVHRCPRAAGGGE